MVIRVHWGLKEQPASLVRLVPRALQALQAQPALRGLKVHRGLRDLLAIRDLLAQLVLRVRRAPLVLLAHKERQAL